MNKTTEIEIEGVGLVPAKPAGEFKPGDVIQRAHRYTLKVVRIVSEDDQEITRSK